MASVESRYIATAKADAEGRLIEADEVLARLFRLNQERA